MLSRSTVRRLLVWAGLSSPRHRRPPRPRCRRQRMPQEGMLLQLDGSHHSDPGWCCCWRWTMLLRRHLMPYSKNRRIPEAICPYFRASLKSGESPWRYRWAYRLSAPAYGAKWGQWTRSWTWMACCASKSCGGWPKITQYNTTDGLCNSFPVWSDPATPELGWRYRNVWMGVCWYGIGSRSSLPRKRRR